MSADQFQAINQYAVLQREQSVSILPKPIPSPRVGLHESAEAFVAEDATDLIHAEAIEIVYPAMLAEIPATGASGIAARIHRQ
jgi:hypothetical protein